MPLDTLPPEFARAIAKLTARVERIERATKTPPDENQWGVAHGRFGIVGSFLTSVTISFGRLRFNDPPVMLSGGAEHLVGTGGDGFWSIKVKSWITDAEGAYTGATVTAGASITSTSVTTPVYMHWCAMGFLKG